jgi:hypothetical protein
MIIKMPSCPIYSNWKMKIFVGKDSSDLNHKYYEWRKENKKIVVFGQTYDADRNRMTVSYKIRLGDNE